jgi:hypothetical protein
MVRLQTLPSPPLTGEAQVRLLTARALLKKTSTLPKDEWFMLCTSIEGERGEEMPPDLRNPDPHRLPLFNHVIRWGPQLEAIR